VFTVSVGCELVNGATEGVWMTAVEVEMQGRSAVYLD
jgi:hypothetical protein